MTRAERRHRRFVIVQRTHRVLLASYRYSPELARERAPKYADNLALCNGPCCGNPRKWFGERTRQERRLEASVSDRIIVLE